MKGKGINGVWVSVSCLLLAGLTGCEYDAPTPMYYQDYVKTPAPTITRLIPDSVAGGGVNTITIEGENFSPVLDSNRVYFGSFGAEVLSASATSLVVRRPNVTGKVAVSLVTYEALEIARYASYKVDTVVSSYGNFVDNKQIYSVTVDKEENVYVFFVDRTVVKVSASGEKTSLPQSKRQVTDAMIGPDGQLYLFANNVTITKMNPSDGSEADWIKQAKKSSYGDFDRNGNLYTGAKNTDMFVVSPGGASSTAVGVYATSDIRDIRVYNDNVYVAVSGTGNAWSIYKHAILDASGKLGNQQLVMSRPATGEYSASIFKDIAFSVDGVMYVATDYEQPVMIMNTDQSLDILYKYIIPTSSERLVWGTGNYIYMVQGGTTLNLLRIDMGAKGAPYWGRL